MMRINRQKISSSSVSEIGYDPETTTLEVMFASGKIYQYKNVSERTYNELMTSTSVGTYFLEHIRNNQDYMTVQI